MSRFKPNMDRERYLQDLRYCRLCSAQNYVRRSGMLQYVIENQLGNDIEAALCAIEMPIKRARATTRLALAHDAIKLAARKVAETIALLAAADRERKLNGGRFAQQ